MQADKGGGENEILRLTQKNEKWRQLVEMVQRAKELLMTELKVNML